jgi:hypothetical protein
MKRKRFTEEQIAFALRPSPTSGSSAIPVSLKPPPRPDHVGHPGVGRRRERHPASERSATPPWRGRRRVRYAAAAVVHGSGARAQ